jgi:excisionase family DNA binding protein
MKPNFNGTIDPAQELSGDIVKSPEQFITAEEVAALLRCSPKSIYRWAAEGRLRRFKHGRIVRFLVHDVETFIKTWVG